MTTSSNRTYRSGTILIVGNFLWGVWCLGVYLVGLVAPGYEGRRTTG